MTTGRGAECGRAERRAVGVVGGAFAWLFVY
jgi:hypothetical protein